MKFTDTTLDDIKKYFDDNNYEYGLVHADYGKEHPNVLNIYRFDGELDEENVYVCGVYKDRYEDIVVKTETMTASLNWGEGYIENEDDDVPIEDIIGMILTTAKAGICEDIDYQKKQISFINDFGKKSNLTIGSIKTASGNEYE